MLNYFFKVLYVSLFVPKWRLKFSISQSVSILIISGLNPFKLPEDSKSIRYGCCLFQ